MADIDFSFLRPVLDEQQSALRGAPDALKLDAVVFAAPVQPFADVMVAGRWVLQGGVHAHDDAIGRAFEDVRRTGVC